MFYSENYGKIYFQKTFHIYIVTYINWVMININNQICDYQNQIYFFKIVDAQNVIESIQDKLVRSI